MISTLSPTKQEKKWLTYSALSTYRRCPMRYNLRYEKNLIPVDTDFKLWLGMVVHKALECWHGVTGEFEVRKEFALSKIDECCKGYETDADKRKTRLLATEMMLAYMEQYRNDNFEVIAIEHEFEGVIRNPKTGWKSKTFNLKGKADGIVKTDRGLFLLEHKTTIRLMESPEDQLWNDTQTGIYVAYLRDLGYDIVGVIYNELPKCSLIQRKGETEEEFQLRHAELCAKNKSGTTTAKRQLPETDEEYAERVRQWYQSENRFRRTELFLSKTQIDLVKQDVWGRLNCVLQIVSGEYSGKTLYKSWIFTQSAMSYIKQDFKRFGLPVESKKFSELVPMLDTAVVGKWCEAAKKQNGQYANVYINSMLETLVETKKTTKAPKTAKTSKVKMFEGAKAVATESQKETAQVPCIYEEAKTIAPESSEDIPF